jgi:hypothetical protein
LAEDEEVSHRHEERGAARDVLDRRMAGVPARMGALMDPKRKAEILAGIKDPAVRAHYEAQLDMAEELERDGDMGAGGIFVVPGHEDGRFKTAVDELLPQGELPRLPPAEPPSVGRSYAALMGLVILIGVVIGLWVRACSGGP